MFIKIKNIIFSRRLSISPGRAGVSRRVEGLVVLQQEIDRFHAILEHTRVHASQALEREAARAGETRPR